MNTSKLWWALGAVLAMMAAGPLMVAILVAAVLTPAAVATTDTACTTTVAASGPWRAPFAQAYVRTSGYGNRFHPIYHRWKLHSGTDLVSQPDPGPVLAVSTGVITAAGYRGTYGNAVDVDHGGGITSRYAHLATIDPGITVGAPVTTGHRLGVEGSTGASTGNHLHFEILNNGTAIDAEPFMAERGAPLDGRATAPTPTALVPAGLEGGIGFDLPAAGTPRLNSLSTPAAPIPASVKALYVGAGERYKIPWTLLAGVGMEETHHGAIVATSSAGARGLMQFMPATFATYGVDGDGDGRASITNPADSIYSAANYLTATGVTKGPAGVRAALLAYNHATWYVNDVLHYAGRLRRRPRAGRPHQLPRRHRRPHHPPTRIRARRRRAGLGSGPSGGAVRVRRQRTRRVGLLQLHPGRLPPGRDHHAPHRRRATGLARRRQRPPSPARQ